VSLTDTDRVIRGLGTYAFWLNWIEAESTALRYFTLDGSDYTDHTTQGAGEAATSAGTTEVPAENELRRLLQDPQTRSTCPRLLDVAQCDGPGSQSGVRWTSNRGSIDGCTRFG
jgi:hypothetical protein